MRSPDDNLPAKQAVSEMTPAAVETASAVPVDGAGDERQNKFHVVVLAFQRVRQLQNGARPRVDASGHKFLWVAMREVMAGMISWSVTQKAEGHRSR